MLDVYKFLEEKNRPKLPPGIIDLSSVPVIPRALPTPTPDLLRNAPGEQPEGVPPADMARAFREAETTSPMHDLWQAARLAQYAMPQAPAPARVPVPVPDAWQLARPPQYKIPEGPAPAPALVPTPEAWQVARPAQYKMPEVAVPISPEQQQVVDQLIRSREAKRAKEIISGQPAVRPVDFTTNTTQILKERFPDMPVPEGLGKTEERMYRAGMAGLKTRAFLTGRTLEQVMEEDKKKGKTSTAEKPKRSSRLSAEMEKFERTPVGKFIVRVSEVGGQIAAPGKSILEDMPTTGNKVVDLTADIAGTIMGYMVPGVGRTGYEAVSPVATSIMGRLATTRAGEKVLKYMAGPAVLQDLGPVPSTIKDVIGRVSARAIIGGLTTGITFAGHGKLLELFGAREVPGKGTEELMRNLTESLLKDFGWGVLTGGLLGAGRATIKEAGPYFDKNSMVRQGYREIKDPDTGKGLGIFWKEAKAEPVDKYDPAKLRGLKGGAAIKAKAEEAVAKVRSIKIRPSKASPGTGRLEFIEVKATYDTLEARIDYLNKYSETEWVETPRGKQMVARITDSVKKHEIGNTGTYKIFSEQLYRRGYPWERDPAVEARKERIQAIMRGEEPPREAPTKTKGFVGKEEFDIPERSIPKQTAPEKILPHKMGAGRIVYQQALKHGVTPEEAQQIVIEIDDFLRGEGLEFNIGNAMKYFGDIFALTSTGVAGPVTQGAMERSEGGGKIGAETGSDVTVSGNKEPWQMTKEEYVEEGIGKAEEHKEIVRRALSEGKPVPEGVLEGYPELRDGKPQRITSEEIVNIGKEIETHFQNWLDYGYDNDPPLKKEVEAGIRRYVKENPEVLDTKSWPEIRDMATKAGYVNLNISKHHITETERTKTEPQSPKPSTPPAADDLISRAESIKEGVVAYVQHPWTDATGKEHFVRTEYRIRKLTKQDLRELRNRIAGSYSYVIEERHSRDDKVDQWSSSGWYFHDEESAKKYLSETMPNIVMVEAEPGVAPGQEKEVDKPGIPAGVTGETVTARTERGTAIEAQYTVVEAKDLIASHDMYLNENPDYPKELQPRDRTRAASNVQIDRIVSKLEPEFLGESPKASEGAPIIGKDGVVESGNARIIALQKIYAQNHKNAGLYREWLNNNADRFGIDKKALEGVENPVLVRIRQTDIDRVKFAQEANEQAVAAMSASEQARTDAGRLTDALMEMFVPSESGELLNLANNQFIAGFMKDVVGEAERGRYITKEGFLSQEGVNRIRNAVFAKAYGDIAAIEKLAESTDVNVKNQINAMLVAAPRLVKIKDLISKGELHNLDISPEIVAAMNKLSSLRESGETVERYLKQLSLVDDLGPLGKDVLELFDKYKRSAKKIASILHAYMDQVELVGNPHQQTLIGGNVVPTKAEILQRAVEKVGGVDNAQITIFQGQGMGGKGTGTQGERAAEAERGTVEGGAGKEGESLKGKGKKRKTVTQALFGRSPKMQYGKGHKKDKSGALEPIKRREIINFLSRNLDIPIRIGRFRQRALGIFKIKPEVIRTKYANDISVIAHEVGHYLDKKLDLGDKAFDTELLALGARTSLSSYSKEQVRAEGVAEFMRLYLTTESGAQKQAPQYFAAFDAMMQFNPEIQDVLLQSRSHIKAWLEQPAMGRILGSISVGEKQTRKMSLDRIYTATVDELRPLKKFVEEVTGVKNYDIEKNPFLIAWLGRGWAGKAETYLYHGPVDKNFNKIGPSLREILNPVKNDLDGFRAYIISRRAIELHKRNKATGIEYRDAVTVIREKETPVFKEALKKLVKFQDAVLGELVEAGVVDKNAAVVMRKLNQYYVPFYRVFEDSLNANYGFGKSKYANIASPVKRLKGSERDIIDPLESIVKNTFFMINVAERNRVGRAIAELSSVEGAGAWVEKLPSPVHGISFNLKEIENALEAVGIDTENIDIDSIATIFRPTSFPAGKENILTVFRNGKKEFYQLDPELYRATLALDKEASSLLINLLSVPARTLRAGATLTPEFMARNPVRDIQEAMIYSKYGFNPTDFAKGLFHALKRDEIFWKWQAAGGAHGAMVSLDRDYLQGSLRDMLTRGAKDKALNYLKNPLEVLRALSEFGEQATRIGEFAKGLKHEPQTNVGIMHAALSSRDVTLDFSRVGYAIKTPNRLIAFFNANVQDIDKIARTFRANPGKTLLRCLTYITLPSVLLYFYNRDDKRYQELPQWQKDLFWIIPTKEVLLRIPKPFTLGMVFGTFAERVLQYIDTQDPKAFDEYLSSLAEVSLPEAMPTAFIGWVEAYANRSLFTGRPIVPMGELQLEPGEQYSHYTSETAKLIGSALNVSPRKADHIARSYGGGLATHGIKIIDALIGLAVKEEKPAKPSSVPADYPLVGAFVPRMWTSSDSIDKFYKELDVMEREYKSAKKKGFTGGTSYRLKKYRSMAQDLAKLRKTSQDVQADKSLTAKEKRELIDTLNLVQINMARKILGKDKIEYIDIKK